MDLVELVAEASAGTAALDGAVLAGDGSTPVTGITHDSRAVTPGTLFCCVPGASVDGHDFAPAAVAAGAGSLLTERPLGLAPEIRVASVREAMGPLAAAVFGHPSERLAVVGVTGTNGKTTITHLLGSIFEAAGRPGTVIGTLSGARTTPEAPDLQAALGAAVAAGHATAAMEVSSHALDQHRVDGTHFAVAVFTNLSEDHLDYHGSMGRYFDAKARLFEPELTARGVVNLDDPHGRLLSDAARVPTVGFTLDDVADIGFDSSGSHFTWRGRRWRVGLVGRFNVANAVAAATAAVELGIGLDAAEEGLASATGVPGRFEIVDAGQPFSVVVDYAHTPDGLEQALVAARALAGERRVALVFGAGGDRDAAKRPLMGTVAEAGADRVVVTSDNPRGEAPSAIIDSVTAGMLDRDHLVVEPDRRAAIAVALDGALPGDVVLIAGKGHETTQDIGGAVVPFDDRVVARELLAGRR